MSRLGGTAIAAGTAINMIQNAWSYLSDAQAAQALSDTGQSFAGGTVIDINKAFLVITFQLFQRKICRKFLQNIESFNFKTDLSFK